MNFHLALERTYRRNKFNETIGTVKEESLLYRRDVTTPIPVKLHSGYIIKILYRVMYILTVSYTVKTCSSRLLLFLLFSLFISFLAGSCFYYTIFLSLCLSGRLSVCLRVCMSVCLSVYLCGVGLESFILRTTEFILQRWNLELCLATAICEQTASERANSARKIREMSVTRTLVLNYCTWEWEARNARCCE